MRSPSGRTCLPGSPGAAVRWQVRLGLCGAGSGSVFALLLGGIGTCAFKVPPRDGMAGQLLAIARAAAPAVVVTAQTLPERNASTAVLEKLGFVLAGTISHPEDGPVWEWRATAGIGGIGRVG